MDKTEQLRAHLGVAGELTLCELGALVIVAGRESGFQVYPEHSFPVGLKDANNKERSGKLDCAWFRDDVLVVAWEFDARDVGNGHLLGTASETGHGGRIGNLRKFQYARALINIQALYSIRDALNGDALKSRVQKVQAFYKTSNVAVNVLTDRELTAGEITKIARRADELVSRQSAVGTCVLQTTY